MAYLADGAEQWLARLGARPGGAGRVEVFVAADGLWHNWQTAWSNGWSDWQVFAAPPQSPVPLGFYVPGVVAGAGGRPAAFTANGQLWRLQQTAWSNGWSDWQPHGAPPERLVIGPVAAARSGDARIEVF